MVCREGQNAVEREKKLFLFPQPQFCGLYTLPPVTIPTSTSRLLMIPVKCKISKFLAEDSGLLASDAVSFGEEPESSAAML